MDRGKRRRENDRGRGNQNKSKKQKPNGKEEGLWFDLKEAKKEVRKFGIAGMTGTEKKAATINMLIGLGAKPPKKKCINYKEFQEIRKKEKAQNSEEGKKLSKKKKKSRDGNEVKGEVDCQIGTFKDGMLRLSKSDIKLLTKTKTSKKDYSF